MENSAPAKLLRTDSLTAATPYKPSRTDWYSTLRKAKTDTDADRERERHTHTNTHAHIPGHTETQTLKQTNKQT